MVSSLVLWVLSGGGGGEDGGGGICWIYFTQEIVKSGRTKNKLG